MIDQQMTITRTMTINGGGTANTIISTISDNSADDSGGGIFDENTGGA